MWQALCDVGWAFGKSGTRSWDCRGGIEDGDSREGGGGGRGFVRSKSFKTGET